MSLVAFLSRLAARGRKMKMTATRWMIGGRHACVWPRYSCLQRGQSHSVFVVDKRDGGNLKMVSFNAKGKVA